jgi:hypothetical protein
VARPRGIGELVGPHQTRPGGTLASRASRGEDSGVRRFEGTDGLMKTLRINRVSTSTSQVVDAEDIRLLRESTASPVRHRGEAQRVALKILRGAAVAADVPERELQTLLDPRPAE